MKVYRLFGLFILFINSSFSQQQIIPNKQGQAKDTEIVLDLVKERGVLYIVNDYQNHLTCLINKIYRRENSTKKVKQFFSDPTNTANKSMLNYIVQLNEQLRGNLTIYHKDIVKLIDDFIEIRNHLKNHGRDNMGKISVFTDTDNVMKILEAVESHLDLLKLNKLSSNNETLEKASILQIYDNILMLKSLLEKVISDKSIGKQVARYDSITGEEPYLTPALTASTVQNTALDQGTGLRAKTKGDIDKLGSDIDNPEESKWRSGGPGLEKNMYLYMRGMGADAVPKPGDYFANLPIHSKGRPLNAALNFNSFPASLVSHDGHNIHDIDVADPVDSAPFMNLLAQFTKLGRPSTQTTLGFEEALEKYRSGSGAQNAADEIKPYTPFNFGAMRRVTPIRLSPRGAALGGGNDDFAAILAQFTKPKRVTQTTVPFDVALARLLSTTGNGAAAGGFGATLVTPPYTTFNFAAFRRRPSALNVYFGDVAEGGDDSKTADNDAGPVNGRQPQTIIKHFDDVHVDAYFGSPATTTPKGNSFPTRLYAVRPESYDPEISIVLETKKVSTIITTTPGNIMNSTRAPQIVTATSKASTPTSSVCTSTTTLATTTAALEPRISPTTKSQPTRIQVPKAGGSLKFSADKWMAANHIVDDRKGWSNVNKDGDVDTASMAEGDRPSIDTLDQLSRLFPADMLTRIDQNVILEDPEIGEMRERLRTTTYHFSNYYNAPPDGTISWKEIRDWITSSSTAIYPTDPTLAASRLNFINDFDWNALGGRRGNFDRGLFDRLFHLNDQNKHPFKTR